MGKVMGESCFSGKFVLLGQKVSKACSESGNPYTTNLSLLVDACLKILCILTDQGIRCFLPPSASQSTIILMTSVTADFRWPAASEVAGQAPSNEIPCHRCQLQCLFLQEPGFSSEMALSPGEPHPKQRGYVFLPNTVPQFRDWAKSSLPGGNRFWESFLRSWW